MSACTAIVPVKAFGLAKSRLSVVLPGQQREAFARECFDHVLAVLESHPRVARIVVSSGDAEVLSAARARGHVPLTDPQGARRLNEVVDSALAFALEQRAAMALVLMGDLPSLCAADVDALLGEPPHTRGGRPDAHGTNDAPAALTLAPDLAGAGTNALLARPPDCIPTCFGDAQSFALHRARAAALGLSTRIVQTPGLCGDVDTAEDYAHYRAQRALR